MGHAQRPPAPSPRQCVLVVDDEEANRVLMSALLSAQGFETRTASDGPSALRELASGEITLMLLDVMMPGMDGLEVCKRAREELKAVDLVIVFLTALSDRESRLRAKLAGADDFLVKPVERFELSFRVQNWLKLRALTAQSEQLSKQLVERQQVANDVARTLRDVCDSQIAHLPVSERETLQKTLQMCVLSLVSASEDA